MPNRCREWVKQKRIARALYDNQEVLDANHVSTISRGCDEVQRVPINIVHGEKSQWSVRLASQSL